MLHYPPQAQNILGKMAFWHDIWSNSADTILPNSTEVYTGSSTTKSTREEYFFHKVVFWKQFRFLAGLDILFFKIRDSENLVSGIWAMSANFEHFLWDPFSADQQKETKTSIKSSPLLLAGVQMSVRTFSAAFFLPTTICLISSQGFSKSISKSCQLILGIG